MKITAAKDLPSRKGPSDWFTGTVWLDPVVAASAPATVTVTRVTFEPNARTAWHTHPMGQALHVVSGLGRIQLLGQPARELQTGDSVWIEAGEKHWHGAAPGRTFVHLAIQEADAQGTAVVWLEQVTDDEYLK